MTAARRTSRSAPRDVMRNLFAIGSCHSDYSRQEITYCLPDGVSLVIATPHTSHSTAAEFSASAVEAAVRQSQRNEHTYLDFIRNTMSAGCVGYFVQITGPSLSISGESEIPMWNIFQPPHST